MRIVLRMRPLAAVLSLSLLCVSHAMAQSGPAPFTGEPVLLPNPAPARFEAARDPTALPRSPWLRYFTTDELGRVIVFYVNESAVGGPAPGADNAIPADPATTLPVIVYVQGSGSQSVFTRIEAPSGIQAGASGGQGAVARAAGHRAMVVIAEKPGVNFMESPSHPGGGEEGSREFRQDHTLDKWSIAVTAAMKAALTLPRADKSRVMVEGHSEGGLVACKVAADNPEVTHAATLAGGGATQLFDLLEMARRGEMCGDQHDPDECFQQMLSMWNQVLADPDNADAYFLGHPHRRWTTFLATSPMEQLRKSRAKVFIAAGTEDHATSLAAADMLYATMLADGRDVTYSRVPGDHGFMTPGPDGKPDPAGWQAMHTRVVDWFLAN